MPPSNQQHVEATIRNLKSATAETSGSLPVLVGGQAVAMLRPVTWQDADSGESVELLAHWREAASIAFPVVFPVTLEGTKRWLAKQLLDLPDRLLFWVVAQSGQRIGHVGLFRFNYDLAQVEIDNIVRGESAVLPGVMEASVQALLNWTFQQLEISDVFLRVFSDNPRAIRLYERCGFRETMRMPLQRIADGDVVRWIEVDGSYRGEVSRYFVTMKLPRAKWSTMLWAAGSAESIFKAA